MSLGEQPVWFQEVGITLGEGMAVCPAAHYVGILQGDEFEGLLGSSLPQLGCADHVTIDPFQKCGWSRSSFSYRAQVISRA